MADMQNWIVNMQPMRQKQIKALLKTARPTLIFAAAAVAFMAGGCVAKRGIDFGHWARTAERVELVKLFINSQAGKLKGDEIMLMLPPYGKVPSPNRLDFQHNLLQEMRNYLPVRVISINKDGSFSDYLDRENILLAGNIIDAREAARIGTLSGATHVICPIINEFRAYPPLVLSLTLHVVDCKLSKNVAEINANFDCKEQQVVMALSEYLQGREDNCKPVILEIQNHLEVLPDIRFHT